MPAPQLIVIEAPTRQQGIVSPSEPQTPKLSLKLTLSAVCSIVITLGFVALNLPTMNSTRPMFDLFQRLERDYRIFGMNKYLDGKNSLRAQVARGLREPRDSAAEKAAENIAVYLFPEMLSDDNFEKMQAQDLWAPLERAIEQAPRSEEGRRWVEELRAVLNDYEGVGRGAEKLSTYAETTLRLYEALGVP